MNKKDEYGISIEVGDIDSSDLSIPINSKFWNLSAQEMKAIVEQLKEEAKLREIAEMVYMPFHCSGESFPDMSIRYTEDEANTILSAMETIDSNPYASNTLKNLCKNFLLHLSLHEAESKIKRVPSKSLRRQIIDRDGGKCRYCGNYIIGEIHIDHKIPYSIGGKTEIDNLVCACAECNIKKNARTPEQAGMEPKPL